MFENFRARYAVAELPEDTRFPRPPHEAIDMKDSSLSELWYLSKKRGNLTDTRFI